MHRIRFTLYILVLSSLVLTIQFFFDKPDVGQRSEEMARTYEPAAIEAYMLEHAALLNLSSSEYHKLSDTQGGCGAWRNGNTTIIHGELQLYRADLKRYEKLVSTFKTDITDLRKRLENDTKICESLELHKDGMQGIFRSSHLSLVPGGAGFVEPLLPPQRHPEICFNRDAYMMSLSYLVHDFASLCRHRLKVNSRTILVDIGASLNFHAKEGYPVSPAVTLLRTYEKFGFRFDHIYAYESTPMNPRDVYRQIPDDLRSSYHWYNVAVNASMESPENPLSLLIENFNKNDFIVVKLDIDTNWIEVPMVQLLLEDERLHGLVDCFYFEHHVMLKELMWHWGDSMKGSMLDSLKLFYQLREKGIAAHFWP